MKKRIKTRRLSNIYHSYDDDVGDVIICYPPSFSLSFSLFLSLSQDCCQQSHIANIFEHGVLSCSCYWLQPKADFSNITVIIRVLCWARFTRIQHYSRFYRMFNGSDGGRTKTIRSKQHRCIIPRYIHELLAT